MLRRIFLHGKLKKLHPDPIEVVADTVAEVIKAISLQVPAFQPNAIEGYRRIKVVGFDTLESLFVDTDVEEIHIVPQLCGGKQGGFFQILIGAALIAASFIPGLNAFAPMLLSAGISMMLGGILQLMSAPKRDKKDGVQNKTFYLGAPKNTVEIGTRIPILYGRRRIGGHYLSFNISSVDTGI